MSTMRPIGEGTGGQHVYADADTLTAPTNIATNSIDLTVTTGSGKRVFFSSDVRVKNGFTLDCEAGGLIDLPLNGSGNFKINGSAVSSNLTATNANTLVDGGDATSLHYHSSAPSISATLPATPLLGELLCVTTTASTLARADASAAATGKCVGTYDGTSGKFRALGADVRTVRFKGSLTLNNGDTVYVSTTAGAATNVDPSNGDTTKTRHIVGTVWNIGTYNGTSVLTAQVLIAPEAPTYGSA